MDLFQVDRGWKVRGEQAVDNVHLRIRMNSLMGLVKGFKFDSIIRV